MPVMGVLIPLASSSPAPLWREGIGQTLREKRNGRGERLTDVAERAGVSPQYLSEVEHGLKDPSSEMLEAIAGALGITVPTLARRAADRLELTGGFTPTLLAA